MQEAAAEGLLKKTDSGLARLNTSLGSLLTSIPRQVSIQRGNLRAPVSEKAKPAAAAKAHEVEITSAAFTKKPAPPPSSVSPRAPPHHLFQGPDLQSRSTKLNGCSGKDALLTVPPNSDRGFLQQTDACTSQIAAG